MQEHIASSMRQQKSQNLLMPGKLEQNVLRKMNLTNAATYNIGHEATKDPKPSHAGKTRAKCATQNEFNKCSNILTLVMR